MSPTIEILENCRSSLLGEGFSQQEELAEIFNNHFSELLENLDIDETLASNITSSGITDPVFNAIKKYEVWKK